jgi:hypothetical protein
MPIDLIPSTKQMQFDQLNRRKFVTFVGGATVAWPLAARAQQPAPLPVIGFIGSDSPAVYADRLRAFRLGLKSTGFAEGQNVVVDRLTSFGGRPSPYKGGIGVCCTEVVTIKITVTSH